MHASFILLACAVAVAYGQPDGYFYALPHTFHAQRSDTQTQYHAQDAFGQYSYGYAAPLSVKQETRSLDGATRGSYSYIDAAGKVQTVRYIADAGGFRVQATNLPQAPVAVALKPNEETAEVAALRAQHLLAHKQAKLRLAGDSSALAADLPQPVQDTPEVAAAKVEFFKRYEAEKLRHKLLSQRQPGFTPAIATASPQSAFGFLYKLPIATLPRFYLPLV